MNYENICGYLCFCYADAVDCGAASPRCIEWVWVGMGWGCAPPCGYCLEASMTGQGGCVVLFHPHLTLWIPAYAGMTGTVQYDGAVWLVLSCSPSPQPSPIKGEGVYGCFVLLPPRPVDTALKPV